ncbi:MAG: hypothetical protein ACI8TE_000391 [Francisella sp.]|jgi:hypothetical protein
MLRKNMLIANNEMRLLLSVIKANYLSDNKNTLQEANKNYVANRIVDMNIRKYIIDCWDNLESKIGYEIALLENNCKKSIINKLYAKASNLSFVIKTNKTSFSKELHDSIKKSSNINVMIKEFKF